MTDNACNPDLHLITICKSGFEVSTRHFTNIYCYKNLPKVLTPTVSFFNYIKIAYPYHKNFAWIYFDSNEKLSDLTR